MSSLVASKSLNRLTAHQSCFLMLSKNSVSRGLLSSLATVEAKFARSCSFRGFPQFGHAPTRKRSIPRTTLYSRPNRPTKTYRRQGSPMAIKPSTGSHSLRLPLTLVSTQYTTKKRNTIAARTRLAHQNLPESYNTRIRRREADSSTATAAIALADHELTIHGSPMAKRRRTGLSAQNMNRLPPNRTSPNFGIMLPKLVQELSRQLRLSKCIRRPHLPVFQVPL